LLAISVVLAKPKQEIHHMVEKFFVSLSIVVNLLKKFAK